MTTSTDQPTLAPRTRPRTFAQAEAVLAQGAKAVLDAVYKAGASCGMGKTVVKNLILGLVAAAILAAKGVFSFPGLCLFQNYQARAGKKPAIYSR